MGEMIQNCSVDFSFECPREWGQLEPTNSEDIRFCRHCQKNVYFALNASEAFALGKERKCVAIEPDNIPSGNAPRSFKIRKPRVGMIYSADELNARQSVPPFVVGVVGEFSARDHGGYGRDFILIDRDNFSDVMVRLEISLNLWIPNRIDKTLGTLELLLRFLKLEDFEPNSVLKQVEPLQKLNCIRQELAELLAQCSTPTSSFIVINDDLARNLHSLDETLLPNGRLIDPIHASLLLQFLNGLDQAIAEQLSDIIHHPEFAQLEGSWRGLHFLVYNSQTSSTLKIQMMNRSKTELFGWLSDGVQDSGGISLDQILDSEFRKPDGEPFAAIIGDFQFSHQPSDVDLLTQISNACEANQCVFVAAASPEFMGMKTWSDFVTPRDIKRVFLGPEYSEWHRLRDSEASRYIALVLPRVLARPPYVLQEESVGAFCYSERLLDESGEAYHGQGFQGD